MCVLGFRRYHASEGSKRRRRHRPLSASSSESAARRPKSRVVADQSQLTRCRAASDVTTSTQSEAASFRQRDSQAGASQRFSTATLADVRSTQPHQPATAGSYSLGAPPCRPPGMNIQRATTDRPPAGRPSDVARGRLRSHTVNYFVVVRGGSNAVHDVSHSIMTSRDVDK